MKSDIKRDVMRTYWLSLLLALISAVCGAGGGAQIANHDAGSAAVWIFFSIVLFFCALMVFIVAALTAVKEGLRR